MKKINLKFSRAKWYVAQNVLRPNWFFSGEGSQEKVRWCQEQFGPVTYPPDGYTRWYVSGLDVRFRDEKDYSWFLLRWS